MKYLKNILLLFSTVVILFFIAEVVLSIVISFPNKYLVATPNSSFTWPKDTSIIKGINEDSHVSFDENGSRSISDYSKKDKAIICIGGSTTACYSLDQQNTWTALLEKKISNDYWVGNFGKPSNHSFHHVKQLEQIVKYQNLPPIETVIVLMGVNDFSACLIDQDRYANLNDYEVNLAAFAHLPDTILPWYRRLTLVKLLKNVKLSLEKLTNPLTHGELLRKHSKMRQEAVHTDELPNLDKGLLTYEKNILSMIKIAKENSIQIVFLSQAVLWHKDLSPEDNQLLFGNKADGAFHFSTKALANGMEIFNQKLENVCRRTNTSFIRIQLEASSINFFDDCHFTEKGAATLANQVYQGLDSMNLIR